MITFKPKQISCKITFKPQQTSCMITFKPKQWQFHFIDYNAFQWPSQLTPSCTTDRPRWWYWCLMITWWWLQPFRILWWLWRRWWRWWWDSLLAGRWIQWRSLLHRAPRPALTLSINADDDEFRSEKSDGFYRLWQWIAYWLFNAHCSISAKYMFWLFPDLVLPLVLKLLLHVLVFAISLVFPCFHFCHLLPPLFSPLLLTPLIATKRFTRHQHQCHWWSNIGNEWP